VNFIVIDNLFSPWKAAFERSNYRYTYLTDCVNFGDKSWNTETIVTLVYIGKLLLDKLAAWCFGRGKHGLIYHKIPAYFCSFPRREGFRLALASLAVSDPPPSHGLPLPFTHLPELKLSNSCRRIHFIKEIKYFICKVMCLNANSISMATTRVTNTLFAIR